MRHVTLSAISTSGADGVAAVSRLLRDVMTQAWKDECRVVTLFPGPAGRATLGQKFRFAATTMPEVLGHSRWTLFTHSNLLRVQAAVPRRLRRPYAVFLHGIEAWNPLPPSDLALLADARLRLANSRFTADRVMEAHPEIGPVIACPLSLPPGGAGEKQGPTCEERRVSGAVGEHHAPMPDVGPSAVLIVGRMLSTERYKGHDQLIDAWPSVLRLVPNAQLIVVGQGDDVARLRARAQQAKVADSVVFTGFVDSRTLESLYQRCRLFAMPSRGEGFGLVYLEAMAHGLPCIGSDEDAAAEVIAAGETGLLVRQQDVFQLSDAIVRLLSDRGLCERMGAAGARRVREVFPFDRFARQVVACLRAAFKEWPAHTRLQAGTPT